jgi:hypothetical protein
MDPSLSTGSSASLDSVGVMMIEKGQVTMVASGSISSLAMIESPDEAEVRVLVVSTKCSVWPFTEGNRSS